MPKVYIAGPMTGMPEWNFPAFHAAAKAWREAGWIVHNPAEEFAGDTSRPYTEYAKRDIQRLQECDAIALLPGWDGPNARGSVWEREIAESLLKLAIYDALAPVALEYFHDRKAETVLQEAQRIVYGEREAAYSHPYTDFKRIAGLWSSYLDGVPIAAQDVAMLMVLLKCARVRVDVVHKRKPKRDTLVDIAGYAECGSRVAEREEVL